MDFYHIICSFNLTTHLLFAVFFLYAGLCLKHLLYKNTPHSSFTNLATWRNIPIVGCLFSLGHLPHETLASVAQKTFKNRIFKIKAGSRTFVVFSDYDDIISIAKKFPDQLFGKPSSFTTNYVTSGAHNDFVKRWKKRRAYTNAGLKHLEKNNVNQILENEVDNLLSYLHNTHTKSARDIRYDVTYYVSRVLYRMSYGDLDDETCEKLKRIIHLMPDYTTTMGSFSLFDVVPGMHKVFTDKFHKFTDFNNLIQAFCSQQTTKKLSEDEDTAPNLLSFFKSKIQKLKDFKSNNHDLLEGVFYQGLVDIIRAGTESTSLLVQWLLVYVAKYGRVQEKMQEEISRVLEENNSFKVSTDSISELHYCNAVVAESLRFCSLNPFLKRELTGDIVTRDGVKIAKGTSLLFNNFALNFNEQQWVDPHSFKPERFLDSNGRFDHHMNEKLLSFGFGNRRCIGVHTGKALVVLMAARLVQKYRISSHEKLDIEPVNGIGLSPKVFEVTLEPITPSKLQSAVGA